MITYIQAISLGFPGVEVVAPGDGTIYDDIVWQGGSPMPSQAALDAFILEETKRQKWEKIQEQRHYRTHFLGVQVGAYRFHTDETSRLQQIALNAYGSSMPAGIMWKTMSGAFVQMTPALANDIKNAVAGMDIAIFTYAEVKKAELYASSTPWTYDETAGWPTTFAPLTQTASATIDSASLTFPTPLTSSLPLIPSDGAAVFVRQRAGRNMVGAIGASGLDYAFQPFIAAQKVAWWTASGSGTVVSLVNFGNTTTGSTTARTITSASMLSSLRRIGYVSGNGGNSSCGTRHNMLQFWRGNATNLGGFTYIARFGISAVQPDVRWAVGMFSQTAVLSAVNPSTHTNFIAFGMDTGDSTVHLMHAGTGAATKIDMGAAFPSAEVGQVFEVRIFCPPNASFIGASIENLATGIVSVQNEITTNLPANTVFMSPQIWMNNGGAGGAVGVDAISQYIESDL